LLQIILNLIYIMKRSAKTQVTSNRGSANQTPTGETTIISSKSRNPISSHTTIN
jgi:hypothetical protein